MTTETMPNYSASRALYAVGLNTMTRDELIASALSMFAIAWDRGEERRAALARAEAAERVLSAARTTVTLATDAGEWFPEPVLDALAAYDAQRTEDDGE